MRPLTLKARDPSLPRHAGHVRTRRSVADAVDGTRGAEGHGAGCESAGRIRSSPGSFRRCGPTDMPGMWREFYRKWPKVTRQRLAPEISGAVAASCAALRRRRWCSTSSSTPPSPMDGSPAYLSERSVSTLLVSGAETDVCVLATVLAAVDHGYRVVLMTDAICSSSDEGHDALMRMYTQPLRRPDRAGVDAGGARRARRSSA